MNLPPEFLTNLQIWFPNEKEAFLQTRSSAGFRGAFLNRQKSGQEHLWQNERVRWCMDGVYLDEDFQPSRDPSYYSGSYYVQEPSAMAVVSLLEKERFFSICDLCAAPGGKSIQLYFLLSEQGILVSNEVHPKRFSILQENMERAGLLRALAISMEIPLLAQKTRKCFDCVLLDAPCSGEGMFRKNPKTMQEWSMDGVYICQERQKTLLQSASEMVMDGGVLVYSTCTFNPLENEDVISYFLSKNPRFSIRIQKRIWPQYEKGEGHFVCILQAQGKKKEICFRKPKQNRFPDFLSAFSLLFQQRLSDCGGFIISKDRVFFRPHLSEDLEKKLFFKDVELAQIDKKAKLLRPSHSLAMLLGAKEFSNSCELSSEEVFSFLRGEVLEARQRCESGWTLLTWKHQGIGFGKNVEGRIKNHYPSGLRIVF